MKTRFTVEVLALAGVAAGLAVTTGCRTVHSDSADLSLAPMPSSLSPEPAGNVIFPAPQAEKPQPYYIEHPEAVAALDKPPVAHAAPSHAVGQGYSTYKVKAGDSISKIAAANGFRTADVLAVNPGLNANKIRVGQTIVLPGAAKAGTATAKAPAAAPKTATAAGGTYVVQKGDILGRIAHKFGVKVADLKKANGLTSDKIVVGQKLVIPGAKAAQPKVHAEKAQPVADKTSKAPAAPKAPEAKPTKPEVKPVVQPPAVEVPVPTPVEVQPPQLDPVLPPAVTPAPVQEPAAGATTQERVIVVQENQDLFDIAVKWGVSVAAIKALNNMDSDKVVPGQSLKIPSPGAN